MESEWVGRYQDGYISIDGERVTVSDECRADHGWESPRAARRAWEKRGDFDRGTVREFGNGKIQFDDVSERAEFASLGVATIWRTITFERGTHE